MPSNNTNDLQNIGNEILDSVSNAVSTGDFSHLSESIKSSINSFAGNTERMSSSSAQTKANGAQSKAPSSYNETLKGKSAQWKKPENLSASSKNSSSRANANTQGNASRSIRLKPTLPPTPYFQQGLHFSGDGAQVQKWLGYSCTVLGGMATLSSLAIGAVFSLFGGGTFGATVFFWRD